MPYFITRLLEAVKWRYFIQKQSRPPQPLPNTQLERHHWNTARELWIVGFFVGAPGWAIIKPTHDRV